MLNLLSESPLLFVIAVVNLIIAITVHEFAHAIAADRLGDPTPRLQGRISLNPARHLDLYGSLFMLLAGFGWGKPVEFDPFNLREPRRDAAIISFAGPLSNLLLALITGGISWALVTFASLPSLVMTILYLFIYTNISLAVFNLIPIHPLDGFKIVGGLLPRDKAHEWYSLERYGIIFLILLIMPIGRGSMVSMIIRPIVNFLVTLIAGHLVTF
jgi:Zn-dependent protease